MKKISVLTLLAVSMSIVACQPAKKNNVPDDSLKDDEVEVRLPHNMNQEAQDYNIRLRFDDAFFKEDAKGFNQELALLSLGNTFCAASSLYIASFYERLQFDSEIHYANYSITPTEDTIGYSFAHKKIDNFDLVAISIRGFDYGQEWANNFLMGESGNHQGFQSKSDEIYADLKATLETANYENLKLWITGYSRGGGVANVLSHQILSSDEIDIAQEDMFVYTFEAPRGLTSENAIEYSNVHNIINKADLVTYIAPAQYGLFRCGVDLQIYDSSSNLSRLLKDFDKDIVLPTFTPTGNYADEQAYIENILEQMTAEKDEENQDKSSHTRQDFVNNYQDGVRYMVGLFFSLSSSTTNKLMEKLNNATITEKISLATTDGIYNFIKPVLDEDHVAYDDEELHTNCNIMTKFLQSNLTLVMTVLNNMDNLMHIIYMHMPEAEYVLLKDLKVY